eukprot:4549687-Prymnesium_polylepis.1
MAHDDARSEQLQAAHDAASAMAEEEEEEDASTLQPRLPVDKASPPPSPSHASTTSSDMVAVGAGLTPAQLAAIGSHLFVPGLCSGGADSPDDELFGAARLRVTAFDAIAAASSPPSDDGVGGARVAAVAIAPVSPVSPP